jgi:hypothetical protein
VSASRTTASARPVTDFLDVNGDGLPITSAASRAETATSHVRLNLGYAFSEEILWPRARLERRSRLANPLGVRRAQRRLRADFGSGRRGLDALDLIPGNELRIKSTNVLRLSDSQTNNASVGIPEGASVRAAPQRFAERASWSTSVDLNGDDLPDQVLRDPNEAPTIFHVKLNLGGRFAPEQTWALPDWSTDPRPSAIESLPHPDGVGWSTMAGWAASVHFEICYFLCVGFSAFYSRDNGGANVEFQDVDGDGKPEPGA